MSEKDEMEALLNAVAASIYRDAERYRWLRTATAGDWEQLNDIRLGDGAKALDAAIDAAAAIRNGGGE